MWAAADGNWVKEGLRRVGCGRSGADDHDGVGDDERLAGAREEFGSGEDGSVAVP